MEEGKKVIEEKKSKSTNIFRFLGGATSKLFSWIGKSLVWFFRYFCTKLLRNIWRGLTFFIKRDSDAKSSYSKMVRFFFTQIFFSIAYFSSVFGYGFGSSWKPEFFKFLSGANFTMFMVGLLNWWVIKNFQDCNAGEYDYKKDNLIRFDICTCICILPLYIIVRPIFWRRYKKILNGTFVMKKKEKSKVVEKETKKS